MRDESAETRALLEAVGLNLPDEDVREVATLRRQFTADRETLAALDLGQAEPMTTFCPRPSEAVKP